MKQAVWVIHNDWSASLQCLGAINEVSVEEVTSVVSSLCIVHRACIVHWKVDGSRTNSSVTFDSKNLKNASFGRAISIFCFMIKGDVLIPSVFIDNISQNTFLSKSSSEFLWEFGVCVGVI
jgi:hypothetical protein